MVLLDVKRGSVVKERGTIALWTVNLLAIIGSTFNYVYLSYYLYEKTHNQLISQIVFFGQMLLPVVLVAWIQRLSSRYPPRILLLCANGAALVVASAMYPLLPQAPTLAVAGALLIGVIDAIQRVARIVAIKVLFRSEDLKGAVPLTLTAQFVAGGLAGALLALFRNDMTPMTALVVSCTLFASAMAAAWCLPRTGPEPGSFAPEVDGLVRRFRSIVAQRPQLRQSFYSFVFFIAVFQGFFNVSRIVLPAQVLHLDEGYVGLLQLINSGAALVGAIVFYRLNGRYFAFAPLLMVAVSSVAMVTSAFGLSPAYSFGAFFVYILFFEFAFFRLQADIVASCASSQMPIIASVQYAAVYAAMLVAIAIGGLLVDLVGLGSTAMIFVATYVASLALFPQLRPSDERE